MSDATQYQRALERRISNQRDEIARLTAVADGSELRRQRTFFTETFVRLQREADDSWYRGFTVGVVCSWLAVIAMGALMWVLLP